MRSMQKEFEEFKKENEELNGAELSFEANNGNLVGEVPAPVPILSHTPMSPPKPLNENGIDALSKDVAESPADDAESSHFSLGAPPIQHSNHENPAPPPPESLVDRQISMLVNRLVGLVNGQR